MALRAQFDRWFVWDLREECKAIGELSAVWTGYSTGDQDMHDDKSVLKIKLVRSRCDRKPSSLVEAIQALHHPQVGPGVATGWSRGQRGQRRGERPRRSRRGADGRRGRAGLWVGW